MFKVLANARDPYADIMPSCKVIDPGQKPPEALKMPKIVEGSHPIKIVTPMQQQTNMAKMLVERKNLLEKSKHKKKRGKISKKPLAKDARGDVNKTRLN